MAQAELLHLICTCAFLYKSRDKKAVALMYPRKKLDASALSHTRLELITEFSFDIIQFKLWILLQEPVYILYVLRRIHRTCTVHQRSSRLHHILRAAQDLPLKPHQAF